MTVLSLISVIYSSYAENREKNEKNSLGNFVTIPGGTYEIGSPVTEAKRRLSCACFALPTLRLR